MNDHPRQEIDEEAFFGATLLMDLPYWCPRCEDEVKIREDLEPRCPICGTETETL